MTDWLNSEAVFTVDSPQAYVDFWLSEFEEHGYDYAHPSPWRLDLSTPYGIGSMVLDGATVTVALQCPTMEVLFDVRADHWSSTNLLKSVNWTKWLFWENSEWT